jgi:hypothetical protein
MSLPPLPLIDNCLFIDNSGWIENLATCSRKLQHQCLSLRVHTGEKPALNFGSAGHLAKELRYARYGNKHVDEQYYEDLTTLLTEFFDQHPTPGDDWRGLNWAIECTRKYNDRFADEDFNLLEYKEAVDCPQCRGIGHPEDYSNACLICLGTGKRKLMVEMPFALPLYTHSNHRVDMPQEIHVIYTGRIDLPVNIPGVGIFTNDFKHVGSLGEQFWNGERMSSQHRGYCWAFQQLTGMAVTGFMITAIRTKEPPQYVLANKPSPKGGKTQSPTQWWAESIVRDRFPLRTNELDQWKNNVIELVEEFFWHYERGYMPMKTKWCNSYGKCPYLDVCSLPPEEHNLMLQSGLYALNEWSPLNKSTPTQSMQ